MSTPVPTDSRYVPLTQQKSCCVPTCIQMVMLKRNIPLKPAEEIGYALGLIVSPERKHLFYHVRTSSKKPPAGYGTRIYDPRFELNTAFKSLKIPLQFTLHPISQFTSATELKNFLSKAEADDRDILLCFNHGALTDDPTKNWGHVTVFDRTFDDQLRMIDPSPDAPKWRDFSIRKMFAAMKTHGEKRSGGVWELQLTKDRR
jgi:hypothetical protein